MQSIKRGSFCTKVKKMPCREGFIRTGSFAKLPAGGGNSLLPARIFRLFVSAGKLLLKNIVLACYHLLARLLPVSRKTVVFMSSLGRNYTGNPRAICEEMARQGLTGRFRCYYIFDEPKRFCKELPQGVRAVKNARFAYYAVMAVAGVWVSDTRFQNYMVKRKKTIYIQTWHGTPLKKLGLDLRELHMAGGQSLAQYQEEFRKNTATWDYLLSQNPFSSKVFLRAFDFRRKILEIGYPRNDILVRAAREVKTGTEEGTDHRAVSATKRQAYPSALVICRALRERLRIPEDKKVMLYAPTWRDNAFYNERDYRFETELDFAQMREAFGDSYILVAKYHYLVREKADWNRYPDFIRTAGDEVDIGLLYLIADLLITDYSSAMFDYSILRRPMYFYAYDLENYRDALRGFYFDFEAEAPGPVVTTTKALIAAIKGNASRKYQERYDRFAEKYNPFDDGDASEKVVDIIKNVNIRKKRRSRKNERKNTVCHKGTD